MGKGKCRPEQKENKPKLVFGRLSYHLMGCHWRHAVLKRRPAAALIILALLAGCASPAPFAPRGPGQATGYTDRQLAANRWRVTFTGNSVTPREQVEDDLLLRAAQISLAAGSGHFLFDTRDTQARNRVTAFPEYEPGPFWGRGWRFRPSFGYGAFGPDVDIVTTTSYQAYAEIVTLTDDQAAHEPRAVDAHAVVQNLTPPAAPPA
jgi:hypothetical protein